MAVCDRDIEQAVVGQERKNECDAINDGDGYGDDDDDDECAHAVCGELMMVCLVVTDKLGHTLGSICCGNSSSSNSRTVVLHRDREETANEKCHTAELISF